MWTISFLTSMSASQEQRLARGLRVYRVTKQDRKLRSYCEVSPSGKRAISFNVGFSDVSEPLLIYEFPFERVCGKQEINIDRNI